MSTNTVHASFAHRPSFAAHGRTQARERKQSSGTSSGRGGEQPRRKMMIGLIAASFGEPGI
ncbi:unnamed protein product [Ectocarpus sp. 12 AP-2014]